MTNERRITQSPQLKEEDNVAQHSGQNQFSIREGLFENSSPCDKKVGITDNVSKPFTCGTCYKTFSLKCNLKKHKVTHTGERTFSCDICEKQFTRRSNLNRHKSTHCGNLNKHILIHHD